MEYMILKSFDANELENRVKQFLTSGYVLAGGVAIGVIPGPKGECSCRYCQAVFKPDPAETPDEPNPGTDPDSGTDPDPTPDPSGPVVDEEDLDPPLGPVIPETH